MLIATNGAGRVVKKPSKPVMGTMLANLHRSNTHLVLERVEDGLEGSWYVQVLLRDDNTYQLEYRDGVAAEHYQTRTIGPPAVGVCRFSRQGRLGGAESLWLPCRS